MGPVNAAAGVLAAAGMVALAVPPLRLRLALPALTVALVLVSPAAAAVARTLAGVAGGVVLVLVGCAFGPRLCRRCWIRRHGWPAAVYRYRLPRVGPVQADPGNPGQHLARYDVPARLVGPEPARLLLAANGTPDRTGRRAPAAITVPPTVRTALAAAAWASGTDTATYRQLTHRT